MLNVALKVLDLPDSVDGSNTTVSRTSVNRYVVPFGSVMFASTVLTLILSVALTVTLTSPFNWKCAY